MMRLQKVVEAVASNELWLVLLIVGISMAIPKLLLPAVAIILILWIARRLAFGRWIKRTPADWAILCLLLTLPVTLWATVSEETTASQVLRLITGIGLYYAIAEWTRERKQIELLISGMAIVGILLSILGLIGVEWTTGKLPFIPNSIYQILPRLVPDSIHRNVLAGSLVIVIPLLFAILLFAWRSLNHFQHILYSLSLLFMLFVLVLTQSRGGLISFLGVTVLLIVIRWKRGWFLPVLTVAFIIIGDRLFGILSTLKNLMTADMLGGFEGRMEIWSRALAMIQDFPFTGVGMGNFGIIADTLYPFVYHSAGSIPHAHNLYLQIAVDLGLPGLISWLAILLIILKTSWNLYRKGQYLRDSHLSGLGVGLMSCQVALSIHGILDAVTWGMVRPAPMVWAIWGIVVAAGGIYLSPNKSCEEPSTFGN